MASDENDGPCVYLLGKTHLAGDQVQFHIRNDAIVHMAAGDQHTIIVTESGRAFAFGNNSSGQLGLGHTNPVDKVSCIRGLKFGDTGEKVILAACGRESSLVATNRGSLYSFGSNIHCQLALESKDDSSIHPEPVKILSVPSERTWKQIAMGAEHACALTDKGEVFVWGSNEEGQCGQVEKHQTITRPQELRIDAPVKAIACGYYHTAFVSEDGRIFLCGNNEDRQLGRSKPPGHSEPVEVSMPSRVKAVACGNQHTVVLTEDGSVYTCGRGDRGQLGLGSQVQMAESFELVELARIRAVDIAAGEAHSAVLDARGNLYIFGDGKHGKLGFTTHSNEFSPCAVDQFQLSRVLKVVCGGCQTIVLAQNRSSTERETVMDEEDDRNKTLSKTLQTKSPARLKRLENLNDRSRSSLDRTLQPVKPLETFNPVLRTERVSDSDSDSDGNHSDPKMSTSMKSDLFRTTHLNVAGTLQPTHTSLKQTTFRGEQNDVEPLRTGALDRTVRLGTHAVEQRLQNQDFPPTDRPPMRERQLDRSRPKKDLSDEEHSASESIASQHRKKPREPVPALRRKQGNRRPAPKHSDSDDDHDQKHYPTANKATKRASVVKPPVESGISSVSSSDDQRSTDRRSQSPRAAGRGPLPKLPEPSTPIARARQGNQTNTARPTTDNRTRTLAATNPTQDRNQNSAINEAQPGFLSRLFSPKQPPAAPPVTQNSSKTCSVM